MPYYGPLLIKVLEELREFTPDDEAIIDNFPRTVELITKLDPTFRSEATFRSDAG